MTMKEQDSGLTLIKSLIQAQAEYARTRDPVDHQHALESAVVDWRNANRGQLPAIELNDYDDREACFTVRMVEDLVRVLIARRFDLKTLVA